MKVAIYGAGQCGEYVIKELQAHKNPQITGCVFIDNNRMLCGEKKYGLDVVSLEDFVQNYMNMVDGGVIIATSSLMVLQEMVVSLLNYNYYNIYLMPEAILDGKLPILNEHGYFLSYIQRFSERKPTLPYVEYHISDCCNLKCRGCGHFSNLSQNKNFPDINEFIKSLICLSERFSNIKNFG